MRSTIELSKSAREILNNAALIAHRDEWFSRMQHVFDGVRDKALFHSDLVEIAAHSSTHCDLTLIPETQLLAELFEDRKFLEAFAKRFVRGFSYPYGALSPTVITAAKLCGYQYARTNLSTGSFALPENWMKMSPTSRHRDPALPALTEKFIETTSPRSPWLFHIFGHSYEFEQQKNWDVIEQLIQSVAGKTDIWYAASIEIFDYVQNYNRLIFSGDCNIVKNPSAEAVWILCNENPVEIRGGESVTLEV